MIITIIVLIIFIAVFLTIISAFKELSNRQYNWHSYCKNCNWTIIDKTKVCGGCGVNDVGTRKLNKTTNEYEYK